MLLVGGSLVLSACQGNTGSSSSMTQSATIPATQQDNATPGDTTASESMKLGNSNQNYAKFGVYVENDGWVWYSDREDSLRQAANSIKMH